MWLVFFAAGALFLFGLVQWARSGAVLWNLHSFLKKNPEAESAIFGKNDSKWGIKKENDPHIESARRTVRSMESITDEFLLSSFKVLGALALCVWLFVVTSVVLDILGIDWLSRLRYAGSSFWGNPAVRSPGGASSGARGGANPRSNFLRQLRSTSSRR